MKKLSFLFAIALLYALPAHSQMPTVGGAWYIPATQTALLVSWSNGKITKVQYAKGNGKFANATLKAQAESDMGYRFSYSLPTAPAVVYEATQGFSPLARFLSIQTVGTYESIDATQFAGEEFTSMYDISTASDCAMRFLRYFKYVNNENQAEINPDDAQEGLQVNQVALIYKYANGDEEEFMATINPTTHELSFSTPTLGKVRMKLNPSGFDLFDSANQPKGSFSFQPPR